ncbi:putative ATPase [Microbacteriaceae bacterium SG_E_30_P1]|uniref:ATPase n=1 Tax=Antiquaquibacter oligotrophicus TaxID=2880260 RepID=A0ABT6KRV8_9MICO|nr:AAA family ATPase [Antiquaquibacter oligotrophicus]MDH6182530.1 putative ATPase [Antiquaquibacter oligotrophicus]UDF14501.1 AAA family ATPase [Antiquaquibacter oligotrophicus]
MLQTLAVENYRSLRHLVVPLSQLTVVTGANGTGKSSVYRSLRLLAEASLGGAVSGLAREGGLASTLWAGPGTISKGMRLGEEPIQGTRRTAPVALRLGFASDDLSYSIEFGLPVPSDRTLFSLDPEIKVESVWSGMALRPGTLLTERRGADVRMRDERGDWMHHPYRARPFESVLSEYSDPQTAPELYALREMLRSWRFYDHLRTDAGAPARRLTPGTRTPVLPADGSSLAAALQTVRELGTGLDEAIDRAFPGSSLVVDGRDGLFDFGLRQPGMLRALASAELSDGTIRYLLWVAALLSPRPPKLLVLNEPETSLHPDLTEPLAELIADAATRSQVIVVTHSTRLADALPRASRIHLAKDTGETTVVGQGMLDEPAWTWPKR